MYSLFCFDLFELVFTLLSYKCFLPDEIYFEAISSNTVNPI
jgi:hypothetical protein